MKSIYDAKDFARAMVAEFETVDIGKPNKDRYALYVVYTALEELWQLGNNIEVGEARRGILCYSRTRKEHTAKMAEWKEKITAQGITFKA